MFRIRASSHLLINKILMFFVALIKMYLLLKVTAGVEMTLIDVIANSMSIPLWRLFGRVSNFITIDITV